VRAAAVRDEEECDVSPSKREREYARQRYEKWQERLAQKQQRRRRRRQMLLAGIAALAVVAVAVGVFWLTRPAGNETATPAEVTATPSAAASDAANPCPAPSSTPAAEPAQLDAAPDPSLAEGRVWTGTLNTSCGPISLELYGDKAPQAVSSFVDLARNDFFAGTPCHRLTTEGISVLQCGDPTGTGSGGPGYTFGPVENAPADDVYPAGTLAMARVGGDASSMGSQFFLVYGDSTIPSDAAGGYTVFGRITAGLDVVQQVADGGVDGGGGDGRPARAISIEQVTIQ
jgi:peptidyl-prolyl cis-trans isomerase B (cyclophilin B)